MDIVQVEENLTKDAPDLHHGKCRAVFLELNQPSCKPTNFVEVLY